MSSLSTVLKAIIADINTNFSEVDIPKVTFDELSTSKDSICLSTVTDASPQETVADVTSNWVHGKTNVSITYRIMLSTHGADDLVYCAVLDALYYFIKARNIGDNEYFVDDVSLVSAGVLDTIYEGGVKDYKLIFSLDYERRI